MTFSLSLNMDDDRVRVSICGCCDNERPEHQNQATFDYRNARTIFLERLVCEGYQRSEALQ